MSLDGSVVPAEGSFPLNADRELVATADSAVKVEPADSAIVRIVGTLFTTSDPATVFGNLLVEVGALQDKVGAQAAQSRLEAMSVAAPGDFDAFMAVQGKLANRTFEVDGGSSGPATLRANATNDPTIRPLRVIYVNGISTTPYQALQTSWEVRNVAAEAGYQFRVPGAPYAVLLFYNATFLHSPDAKRACLLGLSSRLALTGALSWTQILTQCTPLQDLTESGTQLLNLLSVLPVQAAPDAAKLEDFIKLQIAAGNRVVLVTHSQGNLLAQQALTHLLQSDQSLRSCIGVVSLAAPTNAAWPSTAAYNDMVVGGTVIKDIILRLGLNALSPLPTELSARLESEYAAVGGLKTLEKPIILLGSELQLHYLGGSYLGAPTSRQWVVNALRSQDTKLMETCPRVLGTLRVNPTSVAIQVGDAAPISAQLTDQGGNVIQNPPVVWSSSSSAVATISATGAVQGVAPGEAQITARVGSLSATATVTVRARSTGPHLVWKFQDPAPTGNPAISGVALGPTGTVYTLTGNGAAENRNTGALYALHPDDGHQLWHFSGWEYTRSGPVVGPDGTIYFTGTGGFGFAEFVAAVSPAGVLKWVNGGTFAEVGYFYTPVIGPGGTVLVTARDGIFAFDAGSGSRRWTRPALAPSGWPAVGESGVLYVGTKDSAMQAIRVATGETLWRTKLDHNPGDMITLNGSDVMFGTVDSYVIALSRETGAIRWQRNYPGLSEGAVTVGPDNALYVSSGSGRLTAVDGISGAARWSRSDGQVFWPATLASDGTVLVSFIAFPKYTVHALNPSTGVTLWSWQDDRLTGVLLPRTSGRAYLFGQWSVSALSTDLPGLATSAWPMSQHDPQRSSQAP